MNQELVLVSFEEQGWPECIHDPIPPRDGLDSKRCLHDTIKRINRGQLAPLLRFHGDGNGQAVYWEALNASGRSREEVRQDFVDRQPMGRLGTPAEVSALAVFLASDDSSFVTGPPHLVDGGMAL